MFSFLCERILPKWRVLGDSANTPPSFIQTPILPIKSFFSSSSTSVKDELQESFTVSYLINSCGFPSESAISASQKVNFETPEKPDSVLTLFRDHGFTYTLITKLLRTFPYILLANPVKKNYPKKKKKIPVKTLLPKLEFFHSIGFSSTDLAEFLSSCPLSLRKSLEKQLMTFYNFLKSLLLDDEKVIKVMKNWNFNRHSQKNLVLNISVLRELGVPESLVLLTFKDFSSFLLVNRDMFDKIVEEVIEMGYNPKKTEFILAGVAFSRTSKSTREHKIEVFRRWGWSEEYIRLAFKKFSLSMTLSEKKITSAMDFLVNTMSYQIAAIARFPFALHYSLEKRLIPMCTVIKVLLMKGLIKKDLSFSSFLGITEKHFQDKFVTKYQEDVPHLLDMHQGKLSLLELGFGSEETCGMKQ